jgi:hypothetical protein
VKFIFDQCVSYKIALAIRAIYAPSPHSYLHIEKDLGWGGVLDPEWLGRLNPTEEWVIVTRDPHQRTRVLERKAWKQANAVMIFLPGKWIHEKANDQVWQLFRWWPEIERTAINSPKGTPYRIPYRSRPSRLTPWED